jgi:PspA associated protein B
MGFLDGLLGRTKVAKPTLERLFAISTAQVTLDTSLGLAPSKTAAICFKPMASARFRESGADIEDMVKLAFRDEGTRMDRTVDEFGYEWLKLSDDDFEDLVTTIHVAAQSMTDDGFGEQLLCAVFGFEPGHVRFIYNFKRGSFYPFVPVANKKRDSERELQLQGKLEHELPIEPELERWYPLWDAPV